MDIKIDDGVRNILQVKEQSSLIYAHWLYSIDGLGSRTIIHILGQAETPEAIYHMSEEKIESLLPPLAVKNKLAGKIAASRENFDIRKEYGRLKDRQINFTCMGHKDYPRRLLNIPDPPYALYYRGRLPEQGRAAVAVIGARNCSEYGRQMAQSFGNGLAMAGVQVISGMARGIDGIGQTAALEAGGYSLGVLGCGVDICYPEENRNLYDMLLRSGGVCSEYLPGVCPKNSLFPPRNRIISGLADIVLVIEAKKRSGTLITVDMALEQGKDVYSLPGRATDALSEGCNRLIKQGAGIAVSPQDIIMALTQKADFYTESKYDKAQNKAQEYKKSGGGMGLLSDIQSELMNILTEEPQPVEKIKELMLSDYDRDISLPELMNQLMRLSLCGQVKQTGGSAFSKIL